MIVSLTTTALLFVMVGVASVGCASDRVPTRIRRSGSAYAPIYIRRGDPRDGPVDRSGDNDNPTNSFYDRDDYFGRPVGKSENRSITNMVERYYALLAKGDGMGACLLFYFVLMEETAEELGPAPENGKSIVEACAAGVHRWSGQHHRELLAKESLLGVRRVTAEGDRGWVMVTFGPEDERRVLVHREGNAWKIEALSDAIVP